jgi:predicted aconitase
MRLTDEEKEMLDGRKGQVVRKGMETLVRVGEAFGAKKMLKVYSAHSYGFGTVPQMFSDAEIEELKKSAESGLRVKCFTTTHAGTPDFNIPIAHGTQQWCDKMMKCKSIYQKMGIALTSTCAPYVSGHVVPRGQPIAWTESSAWIFANSVFGATANREGGTAFFSAITGRTPEFGLHLKENRRGTMLFDIQADLRDHVDYGVLGYLVGRYVDQLGQVPVLENVPKCTLEDLKNFCGALSSSGASGLFHMVGITPEAPTLRAAFGGKIPKDKVVLTNRELKQSYGRLSSARERDSKVEMVVLGCPHATIKEMINIAWLLEGKKVHKEVILWIGTSPAVKALSDDLGVTRTIQEAGGIITTGCCQFIGMKGSEEDFPWIRSVKVVATDSPKCAHYAPGIFDWRAWIGDAGRCINAAVTGKWEVQ